MLKVGIRGDLVRIGGGDESKNLATSVALSTKEYVYNDIHVYYLYHMWKPPHFKNVHLNKKCAFYLFASCNEIMTTPDKAIRPVKHEYL